MVLWQPEESFKVIFSVKKHFWENFRSYPSQEHLKLLFHHFFGTKETLTSCHFLIAKLRSIMLAINFLVNEKREVV